MNFQHLLLDILKSGLTQSECAKILECSQSHISDLFTGKKGKQISYDLGVRIIALHKKRMRRMAKAA